MQASAVRLWYMSCCTCDIRITARCSRLLFLSTQVAMEGHRESLTALEHSQETRNIDLMPLDGDIDSPFPTYRHPARASLRTQIRCVSFCVSSAVAIDRLKLTLT